MKRLIAIALVMSALTAQTAAQSHSRFTYQGELNENGLTANGLYNMNFTLWDSAGGGTQIGPAELMVVDVNSGRFAVDLDFGAAAFDNSDRFLQIIISGQVLAPRQPISRTPYAIQTRGLFVDDNEEVGIGTTTPNAKLHVVGSGNGAALRLTNGGQNDTALIIGDVFGTSRAASVYGITSSELLTVRNDGTGNAAEFYSNDVAVFGDSGYIGVQGESNGSVLGTGVFGLATATAGVNYGVFGRSDSSSGYDFFAGGAGVNYGSSSSQRWKNNVEPIDDPLEKLSKLNGVYFDWDKEHGGHHDIGMIAEEVGEVLPEIVQYEENGIDAIGMDYSKMTPLLVEALKELRAKLATDTGSVHEEIRQQVELLRAEKNSEIEAIQLELSRLRLIVDELINQRGASE